MFDACPAAEPVEASAILRQDKQLVVFPLVSAAAMLVLFAFAPAVGASGFSMACPGGRSGASR
jgi:hypothetical protein